MIFADDSYIWYVNFTLKLLHVKVADKCPQASHMCEGYGYLSVKFTMCEACVGVKLANPHSLL